MKLEAALRSMPWDAVYYNISLPLQHNSIERYACRSVYSFVSHYCSFPVNAAIGRATWSYIEDLVKYKIEDL
jgi:hypothetical protein